MADNAELHGRVLGFLMGEWSRKDNRQLVGVDLLYSPGQGFRDEEIRKWERADEPDFFAEFVNIEKLVNSIVEIAEGEADAKVPGKHRFVVRTRQHGGTKPTMSFALNPGYRGAGDDTALVSSGGGGGGQRGDIAVAQVLAQNNSQLMRTNQQMFDGTIRVLGQQNMNLHEQLSALTSENATLRKELEEARSNKMDRDFQIAMAREKNERHNAGFQKVMQLASVAVAKIGGAEATQGGEQGPLAMLISELYRSLRPDQQNTIMGALDMAQKLMFMEIVKLSDPQQQQQQGGGGPGPQPPGSPYGAPPNYGTP
jgi:predicted amino acid-binding ACT domain protein